MITVRFDVNDNKVRTGFLRTGFMEAVRALREDTPARWGRMGAQHMLEHLLWTFEFANAETNIHRDVPPAVAERMRRFLYDDRPTPRDFMNPLLTEGLPPLRFSGLEESKAALQNAAARFFDLYENQPETVHDHPLFGPLGREDWERALFKHCYHHLLQFGIIEPGAGG